MGSPAQASFALQGDELSASEFARLGALVNSHLGIKMPPAKARMLQARLLRRARAVGLAVGEYCDFLFSPDGQQRELTHFLDAVTTNKTSFLREAEHFQYLQQVVVPALWSRGPRHLTVWSAACSSGEEPYTLAMALAETTAGRGVGFKVIATDVSTRILRQAAEAIYDEDAAEPLPALWRCKYLLRSKDRNARKVRVAAELRQRVRFQRLNLMEDDYRLGETVDAIFCRNVFIYFDRPTQERVTNRLCRRLRPGGYFFVGLSETLQGLRVPLVTVARSVYRLVAP